MREETNLFFRETLKSLIVLISIFFIVFCIYGLAVIDTGRQLIVYMIIKREKAFLFVGYH